MKRFAVGLAIVLLVCSVLPASAQQWPAPRASVIPQADGYVVIPGAAVAPDPKLTYRAVIDAIRPAIKTGGILPALNVAGSLLNDFGATGVPVGNARFAVVFHGAAIDGILDDAHFKAKFGRANPNLPVLAALKKLGVELFVCGQNVAAEHIDPKTLSPDVTMASDALIVLVAYQNKGYALMAF